MSTSHSPTPQALTPSQQKSLIRTQVWSSLRKVALPDSRFHHSYTSFIADFSGSAHATSLLRSLPCYTSCSTIFIAPDNCLQELRLRALQDGKRVLTTTYGIRRGFWVLDPGVIESGRWEVASLLDGMEGAGRHVSLNEMKSEMWQTGMCVTGTGAINHQGLRFGKGHGYFDLEWAMLWEIGAVSQNTKTVALVHECQLLDQELLAEVWDTVCDFVVTPQRVISVEGAREPVCGVLWDRLEEGMEEDIEPLRELRELQREGNSGA